MGKLEKKDIDREYRKFLVNWLPKYVERLTIDLLCLKDKREIPEGDWEVLETAFQSYYMGYCADFIPAWQPPVRNATQQGLFSENTDGMAGTITENPVGANFAITVSEPKIVIEDEKV